MDPEDNVSPWNDALSIVPEEYHEGLTSVFNNWNSSRESELSKIRSDYSQYQPFLDNQISFEELQQGYGLIKAVYEDPEKVVQAIREAFGVETDPSTETTDDPNDDPTIPAEYRNQLEYQDRMIKTMADLMLKQREEALAAEESKELDKKLAELKQTHGNFDEFVVLSIAANMNGDIDKALEVYRGSVGNSGGGNSSLAPRLLSPGGSAPSHRSIDPTKMSSSDRKNLIVDMLKASHASRND